MYMKQGLNSLAMYYMTPENTQQPQLEMCVVIYPCLLYGLGSVLAPPVAPPICLSSVSVSSEVAPDMLSSTGRGSVSPGL